MSVLTRWRKKLTGRRELERDAKKRHTSAQTELTTARRDDVHPRQELVDARDHETRTLKKRRRQVAEAEKVIARHAHDAPSTGPQAALREARKYLGRTESPAGSNLGSWGLTRWIRDLLGLAFGVPWCGVFVGHCLAKAGVHGLTGRVASVQAIYDDAGAGRNGFEKRVPLSQARPGDVLILFGTSTHTALVEKPVPGGAQTIEGNTSPGNGGSQANGGGCFRRVRPASAIVAVCRPRYPKET